MASCGEGVCSCLIQGGDGIVVTGSGTKANPYKVTRDNPGLADSLRVNDTDTVNMSLFGSGTVGDPFVLSAVATMKLQQLSDVQDPQGGPIAGDVPVFVGAGVTGHFEFQPPPATPAGSVNVGAGLGGTGAAITPLYVKTVNAPGGPNTGLEVYVDADGNLRAVNPTSTAVDWANITGKPSTFTPGPHTHAAADITSGVLAVARIPQIGSAQIADDAITTAKIADDAVVAAHMAPSSVTGSAIAGLTITGGNIANATITGGKLAQQTVAFGNLVATVQADLNDIGNASALTSGTVPAARIPGLDASKITSGTLGRPVNSPGTVVAAGDIGCSGRLQSVGSRNFQTTSNYVSAYMDGGAYFGYAPSARRFKTDIKPWQEDVVKLLGIEPKMYRLVADVEQFGENAAWKIGFIAEDLVEAGLEELVPTELDEDSPEFGLPITINYEFYVVVLQMIARDQERRIRALEEKVAA